MTYVGPGGSTGWGSNWQWPGAPGPAATPAPASAPTPPPAPAFDALNDSGYKSGLAAINLSNNDAQGQHDYQTGVNAQTYGYDASGNLISDPSNPNYNPYSQAQLLQHNYDATKRGTVNSYAAQGQLYAGSLLNKQGSDAYSYNVADDALKRAAQNAGHTNDYSLTQTLDANGISLSSLMGTAWTNFLNQQQQGT